MVMLAYKRVKMFLIEAFETEVENNILSIEIISDADFISISDV
jgi:hypothetical protein